jgi:hypothetical protein
MVSSCFLSWPQQRPVRRRRRSSRSVWWHRRRNNITVHYVTVGCGGAGGLIAACSAVAADYLPTVMAVTSRLAASAATASLHRPIVAATSSVPSTSAREEETLRHGFFSRDTYSAAAAASRICATFVCVRSFYRRRCKVYTSGGRAQGLLSRWRRWSLAVQAAPRLVAFTRCTRRIRRRSTRRLSA